MAPFTLRGSQGSGRVGVFSNTWSVSGNCGVIAVAVGQGAYGRMCVLKCETAPSFSGLLLASFAVIPSRYDNILFTFLFHRHRTAHCLPVLRQRLQGKQKPLENNKISFKSPLCDTLCATL